MNTTTTGPTLLKSVVIFAGLSIIVFAMKAASEVLAPILLALILAICTTPFLYWLMKKGASGGLALIVTIIVDVILFVAIVWLISLSVQDFAGTISAYEDRFVEIKENLGGALSNLGVNPDDLAAGSEATEPQKLLEVVAGFVGGLVSGVSNWVLIIVMTVFFLLEATIMPRKVESITRDDDPDVNRFVRLNQGLREYMVINAGVGALGAVLNTTMLYIVGVEFAVLWGVLSFFFSFVPNIGFLISVIPPAMMALIQFGVGEMLIVIVAYIIINGLVDNWIKPRFIEEGVNISASVTFISLVIWGWVLGPIGAILAVPMSIILQAIFASREETRWMAYLMGSGKEPFNPDKTGDQAELVPEAS